MPKVKCRNNGYERYEKNGSEYLLWQQSFGQDEEQSKQIFSQGILTMLYQIQDSITELKEQISKKGTETIQAIMQTSLNKFLTSAASMQMMRFYGRKNTEPLFWKQEEHSTNGQHII